MSECLGAGVCTNPLCPTHGIEWCNCADGQDGYPHRQGCPCYIHVGVRPVKPLGVAPITEYGKVEK